jgi:hypothetical protein
MAEACPMCGVRLPLQELESHVLLHFADEQDNAPQAAAAAAATGAAAGAAGSSGGGTSASPAEPGEGDLVRCPYGCGARVLLEELDSHEEAHRCAAGVSAQHPLHHTARMRSPARARVRGRRALHHPLDRLQDMEVQQQEHQRMQEAAEFEKLQMKFGFSDKVCVLCGACSCLPYGAMHTRVRTGVRCLAVLPCCCVCGCTFTTPRTQRPGKCHHCGEQGHWAVECPKNPRAAANKCAGTACAPGVAP